MIYDICIYHKGGACGGINPDPLSIRAAGYPYKCFRGRQGKVQGWSGVVNKTDRMNQKYQRHS